MSHTSGSQKNEKGHRKMFTPQEDALIVYLITKIGKKDWKTIANSLPNRTARQVRERYRNYLSPGLTNGPWTREEDETLKKLYSEIGPKWSKISKYFQNRSEVNIKNRWTSISRNGTYLSSPEVPAEVENPASEPSKFENIGFDDHSLLDFDAAANLDWGFSLFE